MKCKFLMSDDVCRIYGVWYKILKVPTYVTMEKIPMFDSLEQYEATTKIERDQV